jgi:hypothetical protein
MNDTEKDRDERPDDATADDHADEKLDDLEPAESEGAAVKGGGPKSETSQTGSDPEDFR